MGMVNDAPLNTLVGELRASKEAMIRGHEENAL